MTKKKKICILIIVVLLLFSGLLIYLFYMSRVNNYQKTVKDMTFTSIDIGEIPNGTYIGECDVNFIYAKVEVTVLDGTITKIDLIEHKNERGTPAEKITDYIIREQQLDVDAISGATNSSKVIVKAVEKALLQ